VHRRVVEVAMTVQPPQAAPADLALDRGHVLGAEARRAVEPGAALAVVGEHAIGHHHVEVDVAVEGSR